MLDRALTSLSTIFLGQIWGNMISYLVLTPESPTSLVQAVNKSNISFGRTYDKCGAAFSEEEYQSAEIPNKIDRKTVDMLSFTYTACIFSFQD